MNVKDAKRNKTPCAFASYPFSHDILNYKENKKT